MNCRLNDLQQYSCLCNIEIHGLSMEPYENVPMFLIELAGMLQIHDRKFAVVTSIHRRPSAPDEIPPVVVNLRPVSCKQN